MKKFYKSKLKEFNPDYFPGHEPGITLYKKETNLSDKDRVNNFKVLELGVESTIKKLFGDAFLQKAKNGEILPKESVLANFQLANHFYGEELTKMILEEKAEELLNLSEKNLQKFITGKKEVLSNIVKLLGVNILVVRPEMYHLSGKIGKFLAGKGFELIDSFNHKLNFQEYWALYSEHLIEKEPFSDFPTRTLVYLASKCKILIFRSDREDSNISDLKGERGSIISGTLRGDIVTRESLYLLNSGLLNDEDIFFTLDPIGSYRHIINGEIKSDNIHKKYDFPFLFYAITGIHMPDCGEIEKDLCVLLNTKQLEETLCKILANKDSRVKQYIRDFDAVSRVGSGECEVYAISRGKQTVFLKVRRSDSRVNFTAEAYALKRLGALGAKVPEVIKQTDSFIIISENHGECLNDRPNLFLKETIYEDLSDDLKSFYQIKFNGFGVIEDIAQARGKYNDWTDFFVDIKPWAKTIKGRSLADKKSVETLEQYWQENSLMLKNVKKSYLVHGDFCLDHIFAFKGSYSGIIDFGDSFAGDPLMDLAYFKLKEITKPYGLRTFKLLKKSYEKYQPIGSDKIILINLYMIYWAFRRVAESGSADMNKVFAKKLERLARSLKK